MSAKGGCASGANKELRKLEIGNCLPAGKARLENFI